jgi:hypothetical protein
LVDGVVGAGRVRLGDVAVEQLELELFDAGRRQQAFGILARLVDILGDPMMIRGVAASARANAAFGSGNQNPVRTMAT